jgi:alpha-tubulin suppressor-like RCC1 family protein
MDNNKLDVLKPKITKRLRVDEKTLSTSNKNIFGYSPFKDNDILHVIYTVDNIILLLRNGTCISWGINRCTLGRRCTNSDSDSYRPMPIRFPTKIVDIACGRNHCLARGTNFKVYSWGSNNCGQV